MAHVGDELGLGLGGEFRIHLGGMQCNRLLLLGECQAQMVRVFADERVFLEPLRTKCTHDKTPEVAFLWVHASMPG